MADASDAWLLGFRLMQAQAGVDAPKGSSDMDARLLQAAMELRRKPKLDDGGGGGMELAPGLDGAPSDPKAPEPHRVEVAPSSTPQLASIPRVVTRRKAMRRDRGGQGL